MNEWISMNECWWTNHCCVMIIPTIIDLKLFSNLHCFISKLLQPFIFSVSFLQYWYKVSKVSPSNHILLTCFTADIGSGYKPSLMFTSMWMWIMYSNMLPTISMFQPIAILSFDSSHITLITREILSTWSWSTINKKKMVIFL